jgi:hypothetical protein
MEHDYFPLPLAGEFSEDGRRLTLLKPFSYHDPEKCLLVEVPSGFETDFNSVPRALWGYFPPWQYPEAGVIHDWLYKAPNGFKRVCKNYPNDCLKCEHLSLTRQECDDIHRRILDLKGCRWAKRQLAYAALRAGGWKPWKKYRSNSND